MMMLSVVVFGCLVFRYNDIIIDVCVGDVVVYVLIWFYSVMFDDVVKHMFMIDYVALGFFDYILEV
ncbi:MAG: hypothetical protein O7C59_04085 [Rickettsia endosymbiont of Ixodes persulcatus]|nr:hypothetical protein [Rickettsia endosymbiont of Ixodes persulcatus]